ncbi:tRNA pseudouridine synthase [Rhizoctonia solani 123E]|uniref:tRNA pseudouridine synthase n=1 Tax=Rhizoctonia solani 123E TaxID=1423351 RepID=A0A074RJB3_9AGAM|nr:tRNA pseudouridine synthase [Rhizoctonia solani 123E]
MASTKPKLEDLSKEQLIARIYELERQIPPESRRPHTVHNPFPFAQHPTRKIALKFSYAGWLYNGLAAQSQPTPLATVEQVLFDALVNTRLVDPEKGMDGCGWSRCGRTDRGVSSAGQVVSLWVRSALGAGSIRQKNQSVFEQDDSAFTTGLDADSMSTLVTTEPSSTALDESLPSASSPSPPPSPRPETKLDTNETKQELAYIHMLNRVLPPTIRVLAWSPVADEFDARFSCQWRHYKYFFSRPGLDITAMRDAAARLIGEHDFRNFCKLDPSKQIENFNRRVLGAWIERVGDDHGEEELYVFNLKGTAFLWHQVRCIMAILFLVGQRLEHPSIVDHLLHTSECSSKALTSAPIESKPNYALADSLPLALWDCGYKPEDVTWQTDAIAQTKQGVAQDREKTNNFWFNMYSIWTHDRIQTTMQMYFLRAAERFYPTPSASVDRGLLRLNAGGGVYRHSTRYTPIHELDRGERAEVANEKWRQGASGQRRITKRNTKTKNTDDD